METVDLVARLALVGVFAVAGVGKLLDQAGGRAALLAFGVSPQAARLAGPLIPIAELATAAALLIPPAARVGAFAALVLLLAFIGAILSALIRGTAPDCHCFGVFHSSRVTPGAIYRNAVLAATAAFVAIHGPGPSLTSWIGDRSDLELVAIGPGAAAVVSTAMALGLWRRSRALQRKLAGASKELVAMPPGLPIPALAPGFDLPALPEGRLSLDELRARGLPLLLVFMHPGCRGCTALAPNLARWQHVLSEQLTIAVISAGADVVHHAELGFANLGVEDGKLSSAYRLRGTPAGVLVSPAGRIASGLAEGATAIEVLIRLALRRSRWRHVMSVSGS